MKYKNLIGAEIRRRRNALGWSQSRLATKLQLAGLDYCRVQVAKIEGRAVHLSDYELVYFAQVLKVQVSDLFPSLEKPAHSYIPEALEKKYF